MVPQRKLTKLRHRADGEVQSEVQARAEIDLAANLADHYVEIPAVQSQQQSPSVENANKKKVHM